MKNYIKYLLLFVVLIMIGVIGINLYSKNTLQSNKTIVSKSNTKENKEKSTTTKKESEESDQEEVTVKDETTSNSNDSQNSQPENTKETTESTNSTTESDNLVSSNINPEDLTVSNDTSQNTTSNSNSSVNQEVIILEVTESSQISRSADSSTTSSSNSISNNTTSSSSNNTSSNSNSSSFNNNTSSNSTANSNSSSSTNAESIILEVEKEEEDSIDDSTVIQAEATQENSTNSTTTNSNTSTTSTDTTNRSTTTNNSSNTTSSNATSTTTENITSGSKTNVNFSNIDNCIQNKVIKTVKGSNGQTAKIHICIEKFNLNNTNSMMQNFAITDQFIYFSNPARGVWVKQEATYQQMGKRAALKKTSANYVTRINRSTNTLQRIYVEFAGHTQSFDVTNVANNEQIYMNYFAKLYKGSLGYGSRYVGVTAIPFKSNTNTSGVEVVPTTATSISSNGKSFSILKSASYYENGKLNADSYYDKVVSIGSSSGKMTNPEVAVDEENNRIAFVSGTKAYIYNLEDFTNGKVTLLKTFTIASGKQGVELYNGYLYLWTGNKTHVLYKYKVSTGKLANKISFNLYNYYGNGKGNEAEGISIYKGNVYIGIPGSKCNGKTCNDIFLVEGI